MLDLNCDLEMFFFTNLCNSFSVEWFLVLMNPLVDTSKQFTLGDVRSKVRVLIDFLQIDSLID